MSDAQSTVFDHIPSLRELMPTTGGTPGYEYAQVALANARQAQDAPLDPPWRPVPDARFYAVRGPKGTADVILLRRGTPIRGLDPQAGSRRCWVDKSILSQTGFNQEGSNAVVGEKPSPQGRRTGQGGQGDGRVQAGQPA